MILYATKFYVKPQLTIEAFMQKSIEWINHSSHYGFENVEWDGKNIFERKTDNAEFSACILRNEKVAATKLESFDNGVLWKNEYVLYPCGNRNLLSVRLSKSLAQDDKYEDFSFHRPYLMKQLLREQYGEDDNDLPVVDTPITVAEKNISLISDVICGKKYYLMPIVYVTRFFDNNETSLNVNELAKDLAGAAHIFVEENTYITSKLRLLTNGKNPFNGAVQVYYNSRLSTRFLPDIDSPEKFRFIVANSVFRHLSLLRIDEAYSYNTVKYKKLQEEHVKIKSALVSSEKAQQKLKEDIEIYDALLATQDNEINDYKNNTKSSMENIADLENEKIALQSEVQTLRDSLQKNRGLMPGTIELRSKEKEFCDGEISDLLIEILTDYLRTLTYDGGKKSWRTAHILESVIKSTSKIGERERLQSEIKKAVAKVDKLDTTSRRELKKIGFVIDDDEKHIKVCFKGDSRYCMTLAKTPSDNCEAENNASDITKILFGK